MKATGSWKGYSRKVSKMYHCPLLLKVSHKINVIERQLRYKDKLRIFLVLIVIISFTVGFVVKGSLQDHYESDEVSAPSRRSDNCQSTLDVKYVERNFLRMKDYDPWLINYARAKHLTPPSQLKYNLRSQDFYSDDVTEWLLKLFEFKRDGTFVDIVEGNDGEFQSRSLLLERKYGWKGIIVECNPMILPFLKQKHRKAWIADACVSSSKSNKPGMTSVTSPSGWSLGTSVGQHWSTFWPTSFIAFDVPTLPLSTIIAASTAWKEIDYLNVDIPSLKDLAFLKALPKVLFKVITVETSTFSDVEVTQLKAILAQIAVGNIFYKDFMISSKRYATFVHESISNKIPVRNNVHKYE